jgi:hypothetical protein
LLKSQIYCRKGRKSSGRWGGLCVLNTVNLREGRMKTSKSTTPFRKTAACPASATLLSFRCQNLPAETASQVREHLEICDFCGAEVRLLAHHEPLVSGAYKTPEIPMDLRILAESILGRRI